MNNSFTRAPPPSGWSGDQKLACVELLLGKVEDEWTTKCNKPEPFKLPFSSATIAALQARPLKMVPPPYASITKNIYKKKQAPLSDVQAVHRCDCNRREEGGGTLRTVSIMAKNDAALPTKELQSKKVEQALICDENCHNRALYIECTSDTCSSPDPALCQNRQLTRRQYQSTRLHYFGGKKGFGLIAEDPILAGEFLLEYIGEVIDDKECERRMLECKKKGEHHFYLMEIQRETVIDARYRSNTARFINHSCSPNCETQKWNVNGYIRIGIFAIQDIAPGEEITFNYQFNPFGKSIPCECGSPRCTGFMNIKRKEGPIHPKNNSGHHRDASAGKTSLKDARTPKVKEPPVQISSFILTKRSQMDLNDYHKHGYQHKRVFLSHKLPPHVQKDYSRKEIQTYIRECAQERASLSLQYSQEPKMDWHTTALAKARSQKQAILCSEGKLDWTEELKSINHRDTPTTTTTPCQVSKAIPKRKGLVEARLKRFQDIQKFSVGKSRWNARLQIDSSSIDSERILRFLDSIASTSCTISSDHQEHHDDVNEDSCYRCNQTGNLLCCDGCPAAYHIICAGLFQLPEAHKTWFCSQCRSKKKVLDSARRMDKLVASRIYKANDRKQQTQLQKKNSSKRRKCSRH